MNTLIIAGPLGRDAEMRSMPNGDPVASFSVADSQGRDKPTIWWNCQLFGKRAESLAPYLVKGQQVTVSGSITEREWTDKDGNKRKTMDVRVNDVALQGGRKDAEQSRPQRHSAPENASAGFDDMDNDLPF
jgi:single-strand DNA-binding protein